MNLKAYPWNDLTFVVELKDLNDRGAVVPATSGTVTAFLAIDNGASAEAADASLVCTPVHVGGGKWRVSFDAQIMDPEVLEPLFGTGSGNSMYVVFQRTGAERVWAPVQYESKRQLIVR